MGDREDRLKCKQKPLTFLESVFGEIKSLFIVRARAKPEREHFLQVQFE